MAERIAKYDQLNLECGVVNVRIESLHELRNDLAAKPLSYTLALDEFNSETDPFLNSRLDYAYTPDDNTTTISGFIELKKYDDDSQGGAYVLNQLYEYLVEEVEIAEQNIDESYDGGTKVLGVDRESTITISFAYDDSGEYPQLYLYTVLPQGVDTESEYEMTTDCLRMWGELHNFIVWTTDTHLDAPANYDITVNRSTRSAGAYTLWQSLLNYESWREDIGIDSLPVVNHRDIDVTTLGASLEALNRNDYAFVHAAVLSLAANLRANNRNAISSGELVLALTT